MTEQTPLSFFIHLARAQAIIARTFDRSLQGGLGLNEFVILHHLFGAEDQKMRRIDLADKIGLTASGVTRILLPMEKLGMVKREANTLDARVSFVKLAAGGKRLYAEAVESAEEVASELLSSFTPLQIKEATSILAAASRGASDYV